MLGVVSSNKNELAVNGVIPESDADGWIIKAGQNFGVTHTGIVYAKGANIDGSGTFSGTIEASEGHIGGDNGWIITTQQIYSGTAGNHNSGGDVTLSTKNFTRTLNTDQTPNNLRFAIGSKFGVAADGTLYADGANIKNINANSITTGSISASTISGGTLNFNNITVSNLNAANIGDFNSKVKSLVAEKINADYAVLGSLSVSNGSVYSQSAFTSATGFNAGSTGYVEAGSYTVSGTDGASGSLKHGAFTILTATNGIITSISDNFDVSTTSISIPDGVAHAGQYNVYAPGTTNRIGVVQITSYNSW